MLQVDAQVMGAFPKALEQVLAKIAVMPEPAFARYVPQFEQMFACAAKYSSVECFIFVGQGGAVSSFAALFHALGLYKTTKKVFFVSTTDPDYIAFVQRACPVEKSLVVGISSSGVNVNQLEAFLAFAGYKRLVIARRLPSALVEVAKREKLDFLESPDLSDRFAGCSELGLCPAALVYMPADKIFAGAQMMWKKCAPSMRVEENPALRIATLLYLLEKEGYTEVLVPVYSAQLAGFAEFIMQVMHETVCKEGKGQTFLVLEAPEMQHHSSQRFFDGRKDIVGVFVRVAAYEHDLKLDLKGKFRDVVVRDGKLSILDGASLTRSMHAEYEGTKQTADALQIPNMTLTLDLLTPESVGQFLALWQYVAFYAAVLRGVDPFTQPAVEESKKVSFALRKGKL